MPALEDVLASGVGTTLTQTQLIQRVRHLLEDEPWQDSLTGAYTAASGSVTLGYPTKWAEGSLIEPDDGTGSILRVSVTPTVNPVTVQAGWNGTADANHSINTVVFKNPRFPAYTIIDALNASLAAGLPPGIYLTKTTSIAAASIATETTKVHALPSDFVGMVQGGIVQQTTDTVSDVQFYSWKMVDLVQNVPASLAASTVALKFNGFFNTTNPIYIFYRATPTITTLPDGDLAELVVNLACARLLGAKEVPLGGTSLNRTAANDVIQSGHLRADGNWFRIRAMELAAEIRSTLRNVAPPARRYIR